MMRMEKHVSGDTAPPVHRLLRELGNLADEKRQVSRLYQTQFCDRIRNEADVVTMAIDDIASHGDINAILAAGRADLCAPTRALLHAPNFVRHMAQAQGYELSWPAPYGPMADFKVRG